MRSSGAFAAVGALSIFMMMLVAQGSSSGVAVNAAEAGFLMHKYDLRQTGIVPMTSNIDNPEPLWTSYTVEGALSITSGDINGDNQIEVLFGSKDCRIWALDGKTGNMLWTYLTNGWVITAPAIGDIDGDGQNEVIAGDFWWPTGGNSIYALEGDGTLIWKFSAYQYYEQGYQASPLLYDVNGDGKLDVTIGSWEYHFFALDGPTGAVIWKSERYEHMIKATSPIADLDHDGVPEVVTVDNHAVTKVRNLLTGAIEWTKRIDYGVDATPVIEDLNGDGWYEIIYSLIGWDTPTSRGGIYVLDHMGNTLWFNRAYNYFYTSPTIADVDGDGLYDVIAGDSDNHTIVAFRGYDGAVLWANPLPGTDWVGRALLSVDIDSDGTIEIIGAASPALYCLNSRDGSVEWSYNPVPGGWICGQPIIADVDLNGRAEILTSFSDGNVYALYQPVVTPGDLTIRVAGTKDNTVTVTILEDGKSINGLSVTRTTGAPDTANIAIKMKEGKHYSVVLTYSALKGGSNPTWLTINGVETFINFNSGKGMTQTAVVDL